MDKITIRKEFLKLKIKDIMNFRWRNISWTYTNLTQTKSLKTQFYLLKNGKKQIQIHKNKMPEL